MSKKVIALLLTVGFVTLLDACGGGETPPADAPAESPPAESPSPQ